MCTVFMIRDENGLVEKVVDVMHVTGAQLLDHLHHVSKHLEFWKNLSVVSILALDAYVSRGLCNQECFQF